MNASLDFRCAREKPLPEFCARLERMAGVSARAIA
jgi:hypothetical protein